MGPDFPGCKIISFFRDSKAPEILQGTIENRRNREIIPDFPKTLNKLFVESAIFYNFMHKLHNHELD
jgi:hypothetical protein